MGIVRREREETPLHKIEEETNHPLIIVLTMEEAGIEGLIFALAGKYALFVPIK
jgi:hypothetical protein